MKAKEGMKMINREEIKIILKDIGFTENQIEDFFMINLDNRLRILEKYRQTILDDYHQNCKKIDCLDFLVRKINLEERKEAK